MFGGTNKVKSLKLQILRHEFKTLMMNDFKFITNFFIKSLFYYKPNKILG